jgi:hypothetical protein
VKRSSTLTLGLSLPLLQPKSRGPLAFAKTAGDDRPMTGARALHPSPCPKSHGHGRCTCGLRVTYSRRQTTLAITEIERQLLVIALRAFEWTNPLAVRAVPPLLDRLAALRQVQPETRRPRR